MANVQFSLRSALLTLPAFSVFFFASFALPNALSGVCLVLLSILIITMLVVVITYGRGNVRAFCIGALIPTAFLGAVVSVIVVVFVLETYQSEYFWIFEGTAARFRLISGIAYLTAAGTGFLAIVLRYVLVSDR